jgi:hypothetical protein
MALASLSRLSRIVDRLGLLAQSLQTDSLHAARELVAYFAILVLNQHAGYILCLNNYQTTCQDALCVEKQKVMTTTADTTSATPTGNAASDIPSSASSPFLEVCAFWGLALLLAA